MYFPIVRCGYGIHSMATACPQIAPKLAHQSIFCSYRVGNTLLLAGPPGSQSQANLAQLGEPLLRGAENFTPSVLSFVKQQEGNRRQQKKSYLTLQGYIEKRPKKKKKRMLWL